jgi:hypothetical protein
MKQPDLTTKNRCGFTEGLYVKKYNDGEALVKIFFAGWGGYMDPAQQDEVEAWLTREQVDQLIETLQED